MRLLAACADPAQTITTLRLARPLGLLVAQQPGWQLTLRPFHACKQADLRQADVLIVQRPTSERACRLVGEMQASGGAVVADMDDLLTQMPPALLHAAATQAQQRWLLQALAAADVVSVSTERLGQALAAQVRRWALVPNCGIGEPVPPAAAAGGPTLLFVSSDRVPVAAVAPAVRALQAAGRLAGVRALGPVADDLAAAGVQVQRQAPMPPEAFGAWLRALAAPLAVIPVGDSPFDACKSAIKFYDYALAGIPLLCAARPPYSDAVRSGVTGWLVDETPEAWAAALQRALAEPQALVACAQAAQAEVLAQHRLPHMAAAWQALLESLGPRRAPPRRGFEPGRWWREGVVMPLREANRARLARRAERDRRG